MNSDKGGYMIAYNDNTNALVLKNHLKNTLKNRKLYETLVEQSVGLPPHSLYIIEIKDYYWPIGTHYYEPMRGPYKSRAEFVFDAQHPEKGMLVVGEAVSTYQGWSEGALESVRSGLDKKWVETIC